MKPIEALTRDSTRNFFEPGLTLTERASRGGLWVSALRVLTRLLVLVRTVVLAALLAPQDFGVMGIAMLAISALEMFTQTGFEAALIQKKDDAEEYLDTAWTVGIIRGALLSGLLFLGAPYVANFFNSPHSTLVVRTIAISVVLRGATNIGVVYFQKELDFSKQFVLEGSGAVADVIIAIGAAVVLRNVWALVFGLVAGCLVRSIVSYLVHPYRPRVRLDRKQIAELYGYGKWVLGSSTVLFLLTQGDDALAGKMLGVSALGLYQLAYRISNAPTTEIAHTVSQVSFPTYSQLQDDVPRLGRAYRQVLQLTTLVSFPMGVGIMVLGPQFVPLLLGDKWTDMVPILQVLAVWGMIRSVGATTGPLFGGIGRPDLLTKLTSLQLAILVAVIYPLAAVQGLMGVAAAVLIASLVPNILALRAVANSLRCGTVTLLMATWIPSVASVVMGILVLLARDTLDLNTFASFLALLVFGVACYVGAVLAVDTLTGAGLVARVRTLISSTGTAR